MLHGYIMAVIVYDPSIEIQQACSNVGYLDD